MTDTEDNGSHPDVCPVSSEASPPASRDLREAAAAVLRALRALHQVLGVTNLVDSETNISALHYSEPIKFTGAALMAHGRCIRRLSDELATAALANTPDGWRDEPISEEWLSEIGFKYRDPEPRQPFRHWLIGFDEHDDHGLYVETTKPGWFNRAGEHVNADAGWFLWIGRDSQHIHVRHAFTKSDIVSVIEGLSGQPFDPAKVKYGRVPVALPQPPEVK